eukprot:TRINITY_DN35138_c0_g1_i1.p1 TRINITY_DN35138_c0_g1~~TRINITY_DN35138_c0_g1_i1.p1  ORF type:complete len:211 (-),score=35.54 TRINITY_DN35138_c0_g1_i1:340-972(-)
MDVQITVSDLTGAILWTLYAPVDCDILAVKSHGEAEEGTPAVMQRLALSATPDVVLKDATPLRELMSDATDGAGDHLELLLLRNPIFLPTSGYEGARPGYVFKLGEHGLGYYMDDYESKAKLFGKESMLNGYWKREGSNDTVLIEAPSIFGLTSPPASTFVYEEGGDVLKFKVFEKKGSVESNATFELQRNDQLHLSCGALKLTFIRLNA